MKKLIRRIVLSVAVMLSLAGCRDDMPEMHNPMTNVNNVSSMNLEQS